MLHARKEGIVIEIDDAELTGSFTKQQIQDFVKEHRLERDGFEIIKETDPYDQR